MYTTLSPCDMCTGACVMYKIGRVVIGENRSFVGGEEYLKQRGVEVVVLENKDCTSMMQKYIDENPEIWYANPIVVIKFASLPSSSAEMSWLHRNEDIGVHDRNS